MSNVTKIVYILVLEVFYTTNQTYANTSLFNVSNKMNNDTIICDSNISLTTRDINRIFVTDSVVIMGTTKTSGIKTNQNGTITFDMSLLNRMPKILGNADPIHYAQMLPGVQSNSEYDSGIHISGCDNQHNNITINGVTIYNPSHILGFFSLFNPSHYASMDIKKNVFDATDANRLGGAINMNSSLEIPQKTNGEFSFGLISSQGTVKVPINNKSAFSASLRTSYLNLLYSPWLETTDTKLKYSFTDANLTYINQISKSDKLWIDAYYGNDNSDITMKMADGKLKGKWGNYMIAIIWSHNTKSYGDFKQTVYTTSSYTNIDFKQDIFEVNLPSKIADYGYKLHWNANKFTGGAEIIYHRIHPQSPSSNSLSISTTNNTLPIEQSLENIIYTNYEQKIINNLILSAGLRGNLFIPEIKSSIKSPFTSIDPSTTLSYQIKNIKFSFNFSQRHQFLHQTGISSMGLPIEYWISSNKMLQPQHSDLFSLNSEIKIKNGLWIINTEVFYKKLYNQIEYYGSPFNMIYTIYDLASNIRKGDGYNYGLSIMLNKRVGRLTGWLSYTYTQAQRKFVDTDIDGWYPASHERPHEFNIVATYDVNKRISIGGTGIFASGTPFTAPASIYYFNGNIVPTYGTHNANRLKTYIRIDLSVNYKLNIKHFKESGLDFSLYNAQIRENDIYRYIQTSANRYLYKSQGFILPLLPSISFYAKF